MKQEHSAGPWRAKKVQSVDNKFPVEILAKDGTRIASLTNAHQPHLKAYQSNGSLMSTSPELLESCQEYKAFLEMLIGDKDLWELLRKKNMEFAAHASLQMDLDRVSKRIKKATNDSSLW